ncbi:exo-alpha-sialidase [Shivajiella indica]|uniref:Exo-alpha-sialidase n=1 Tax=Shivajiella indica TaxID=872115 RepID=A0ABW5BFQ4_9BACT
MKMRKYDYILLALTGLILQAALFSCRPKPSQILELEKDKVEFVKTIQKDDLNSEEPYLFTSKKGKTYLTWIEKEEKNSSLKLSAFEGQNWSAPVTVAEGENWFANWADYPQISAFDDGTLIALFLEKSGPGTFSYNIMVTLSQDGVDWSTPFILHDDNTETEHGFVSMTPWGSNMLISWLDGRNTGGGHDTHDHAHHGQMALRAAILDNDGKKLEEWILDERVCDCCQTTSAITNDGPLVIFRDRSENEIRDMGIVKWENGSWSSTMPVYLDLWEIAACPVNGPRVSSLGNSAAVAWYTAAQDNPEVKISFSSNSGKTFDPPFKIDLGKTIGRVDIELLDEENALVSWMEEGKIMIRKVSRNGKFGEPITIATSSEKRSSGFPQISRNKDWIWLVWTDDASEFKYIQVAKIKIENL